MLTINGACRQVLAVTSKVSDHRSSSYNNNEKVWNIMQITKMWHRDTKLANALGKMALNRLAQHRVATKLQFIKNAVSVNSSKARCAYMYVSLMGSERAAWDAGMKDWGVKGHEGCKHFQMVQPMLTAWSISMCVCAHTWSCFSCVPLYAALWTVAHQAFLSMRYSRQEYWSG